MLNSSDRLFPALFYYLEEDMNTKLMTIPEAALVLAVTERRAYHLARSGQLPVVYLGRQVRIDPEALREFIRDGGSASRREAAPSGAGG